MAVKARPPSACARRAAFFAAAIWSDEANAGAVRTQDAVVELVGRGARGGGQLLVIFASRGRGFAAVSAGAAFFAGTVRPDEADAGFVRAQLPVGVVLGLVLARVQVAVARVRDLGGRDRSTLFAAAIGADESGAGTVRAQLPVGQIEGVVAHQPGWVAKARPGDKSQCRQPAANGLFPGFDSRRGIRYQAGSMYDTSDIRKGLKVLMDGNPFTVVEFQFVKPGKGAAFTRTKFKNLLTGSVIEKNIRSGEKLEPANVEDRTMQYLYQEGEDFVFMDPSSYEQVTIAGDILGDDHDLLKDNIEVQVLFFNDRAVGVTLPTFVVLRVTSTETGAVGNTAAGNVTKPAIVETGATVQVPLFINEGDLLKIDTREKAYVERVKE